MDEHPRVTELRAATAGDDAAALLTAVRRASVRRYRWPDAGETVWDETADEIMSAAGRRLAELGVRPVGSDTSCVRAEILRAWLLAAGWVPVWWPSLGETLWARDGEVVTVSFSGAWLRHDVSIPPGARPEWGQLSADEIAEIGY